MGAGLDARQSRSRVHRQHTPYGDTQDALVKYTLTYTVYTYIFKMYTNLLVSTLYLIQHL
jgi:hypothetical protein